MYEHRDHHFLFSQVSTKEMVAAKRSYGAKSKSGRRVPYARKSMYKVGRYGRSYSGPTKAIAAPTVGLGQSARTVLKTDIIYVVQSDAAGITKFYLKPGSCFDPTGDASGIQPALFDQWAATYGRYVVEKAWVCLEFANTSAGGSAVAAFTAAAYPSINNTSLATYQAAASQPFSQSILHGPYDNTKDSKMVFRLNHAKVLGRKGAVNAEDNGGATNSDPQVGQFMVLPVFINSGTNAVSSTTLRIRMYQTVWFDKRINVVDA